MDNKPKPKILIDTTFLFDQYSHRGIGRYGIEIIKRLIDINDFEIVLMGYSDLEANLQGLGLPKDSGDLKFLSLGEPKLSKPIQNIFQYHRKIRKIVKTENPNLYFAVHFDRGIPSDLVSCAVTIHDAIPLATGQYSKKGAFNNFLKKCFYKYMWGKLKKTKLIFTASNFSKKDLIEYGKLSEKQIKVIPLGISDNFRRNNHPNLKVQHQVLKKFRLLEKSATPIPFFIYDSGLEFNKNVDSLIGIYALVQTRFPEYKLVLIGNDFDAAEAPLNERAVSIHGLITDLGLNNHVIRTGRVTDQELVILTLNAVAYLNFSNYEGFGLGPLQAMAAGTPVIISNRSSFPEISGPGAILVNPDEANKAAAQIIELLSSKEVYDNMKEKGLEHSNKYSWDTTFNETLKEIKEVINHGK